MSVFYKKVLRKNPRQKDDKGKFHPVLVTLGQKIDIYQLVYEMRKNSKITKGEVENVIDSLVEVMRSTLYSSHSVHIRDFGIFSLSARTKGVEKVEECTAENIRDVRINFRPAVNVKPLMTATTRTPGEKIIFVDLEESLKPKEDDKEPTPIDPEA